jgi:Catalase
MRRLVDCCWQTLSHSARVKSFAMVCWGTADFGTQSSASSSRPAAYALHTLGCTCSLNKRAHHCRIPTTLFKKNPLLNRSSDRRASWHLHLTLYRKQQPSLLDHVLPSNDLRAGGVLPLQPLRPHQGTQSRSKGHTCTASTPHHSLPPCSYSLILLRPHLQLPSTPTTPNQPFHPGLASCRLPPPRNRKNDSRQKPQELLRRDRAACLRPVAHGSRYQTTLYSCTSSCFYDIDNDETLLFLILSTPACCNTGIEPSPDKMLQARLFSYSDTHRHRLGKKQFVSSNLEHQTLSYMSADISIT